jgi:hypothetical protein
MRGLTAYSLPSNSKIDRSRSTSSTERKQSSLSLSLGASPADDRLLKLN